MTKIEIRIDEALCKGCFFCVEVCPREVLQRADEMSLKGYIIAKVERQENCIECRMCERICPDFAISINKIS